MLKKMLTLTTLILLTSCAYQPYQAMEMSVAIHNAKTKADHEALAKHYEQMAHEMNPLVEEHKKRLTEYQVFYPTVDEQYSQYVDHCTRLIKIYSQAEQENLELAKLHHQMAARLSN